jgi:hypothetical protein
MSDYRPELTRTPMPTRIRALPIDRGYPVPWFVQWVDGQPEFRAMDLSKFECAIHDRCCWVCGQRLGAHLAFVIGPMCAINRTSSEPPCHLECARWSAIHCPFLSRPHMVRREGNIPLDLKAHKGDAAIERNPGCAGVWITKRYTPFRAPGAAGTGWLIEMGPADSVEWYAEGRPATREEVEKSIESGLPLLAAQCEKEPWHRQDDCRRALEQARRAIDRWLPAAEEVRV